ncbi:hypothetical protein SLE2022_075410 [Rubroshorea leprosula]
MEVDNENPSAIRRLLANKALIADLNRKRKLQAEQLGLPASKHQWGNRNLLSRSHSTFNGNLEAEESSSCTSSKVKAERGAIDDGSETDSAKDSNSFGEDYDSVMSMDAKAKFNSENVKFSRYNGASSSSSGWGPGSLDSSHSLDGRTGIARGSEDHEMSSAALGELELANHDDYLSAAENLGDALVEYESHIDYIYSRYGNYVMEQYSDKEIEEIPHTSDANANVYVLSSGRWNVNQEARQTTRKPTIDQEFEQYFSSLML